MDSTATIDRKLSTNHDAERKYDGIESLLQSGKKANEHLSDQTEYDGIKALLEPGEVENLNLKNHLDLIRLFNDRELPDEDFDVLDRGKECNLCKIPEKVFDEHEHIIRETDDYYIVETLNKKGHDTRYMLTPKVRHEDGEVVFPGEDELQKYAYEAIEYVLELAAKNVESGYIASYAGMNGFTHPHIIVSDIQPEEPDKLEKVNNFLLYRAEDEEVDIDEPVVRDYRDTIGEVFLERFYDALSEKLS